MRLKTETAGAIFGTEGVSAGKLVVRDQGSHRRPVDTGVALTSSRKVLPSDLPDDLTHALSAMPHAGQDLGASTIEIDTEVVVQSPGSPALGDESHRILSRLRRRGRFRGPQAEQSATSEDDGAQPSDKTSDKEDNDSGGEPPSGSAETVNGEPDDRSAARRILGAEKVAKIDELAGKIDAYQELVIPDPFDESADAGILTDDYREALKRVNGFDHFYQAEHAEAISQVARADGPVLQRKLNDLASLGRDMLATGGRRLTNVQVMVKQCNQLAAADDKNLLQVAKDLSQQLHELAFDYTLTEKSQDEIEQLKEGVERAKRADARAVGGQRSPVRQARYEELRGQKVRSAEEEREMKAVEADLESIGLGQKAVTEPYRSSVMKDAERRVLDKAINSHKGVRQAGRSAHQVLTKTMLDKTDAALPQYLAELSQAHQILVGGELPEGVSADDISEVIKYLGSQASALLQTVTKLPKDAEWQVTPRTVADYIQTLQKTAREGTAPTDASETDARTASQSSNESAVRYIPFEIPTDPDVLQTEAARRLDLDALAEIDRLTGWLQDYQRLTSPQNSPNPFAIAQLPTEVDFSHVGKSADQMLAIYKRLQEEKEPYRKIRGPSDDKAAAETYNATQDRIKAAWRGLEAIEEWFKTEEQQHQQAQEEGTPHSLNPEKLANEYNELKVHSQQIPSKETIQALIDAYEDMALRAAYKNDRTSPGIPLPGMLISSVGKSYLSQSNIDRFTKYLQDAEAQMGNRGRIVDQGNDLYGTYRNTGQKYGVEVAGQLLDTLKASKDLISGDAATQALRQRDPQAAGFLAVEAYLIQKAHEISRLMNQIQPGSTKRSEYADRLTSLTTPVLAQLDKDLVEQQEARLTGDLNTDAIQLRHMIRGVNRVAKSVKSTRRTRLLTEEIGRLSKNGKEGQETQTKFTNEEGGLLLTLLVAPGRFERLGAAWEKLKEGKGEDVKIFMRYNRQVYDELREYNLRQLSSELLRKLRISGVQDELSQATGLSMEQIREMRLTLGRYLDPDYIEPDLSKSTSADHASAGTSDTDGKGKEDLENYGDEFVGEHDSPPPPTGPQEDESINEPGTEDTEKPAVEQNSLEENPAPQRISDVLEAYQGAGFEVFPVGEQAWEATDRIVNRTLERYPDAVIDLDRVAAMEQFATAWTKRQDRLGIPQQDRHTFIVQGALGSRGTVTNAEGVRVDNVYLVLVMLEVKKDGSISQRCYAESPVDKLHRDESGANAAYAWWSEVAPTSYPNWEKIMGGSKQEARDPEKGGARRFLHTTSADLPEPALTVMRRAWAVLNHDPEHKEAFWMPTNKLI